MDIMYFDKDTSNLDSLLDQHGVTLLEVLDEEDILQVCLAPTEKLVGFLTQDEILKELLHRLVDKPNEHVEDKVKYKYKNIVCDIIMSDIDPLLDKIASHPMYLDIIWSFTDSIPPINPLIGSFFAKVMTILLVRKTRQTFEFLKSRDAINRLFLHLDVSAIMQLFIEMATAVAQSNIKIEISKWMCGELLIERVIELLHPDKDDESHENAGYLLNEFIRIGRFNLSQFFESNDPFDEIECPFFLTFEKRETIEKLLFIMFDDLYHLNAGSSILQGVTAITTLIEIQPPTDDLLDEFILPSYMERVSKSRRIVLEILSERTTDLYDAVLRNYSMKSIETSAGVISPPLGKVRLSLSGLIPVLISTDTLIVYEAFARTRIMNVLLDLFSRYEWNNFLHNNVQKCIFGILNNTVKLTIDEECSYKWRNTDVLVKHLFRECNIIQRCLTLWELNEISQKTRHSRKGYMGHLTNIINEINKCRDNGPNMKIVKSMFNECPYRIRYRWRTLSEGSLELMNRKNTPDYSWQVPEVPEMGEEPVFYTNSPSISKYDDPIKPVFDDDPITPVFDDYQFEQMTYNCEKLKLIEAGCLDSDILKI